MEARSEKGTLYIVVPCYNEEECIEKSVKLLVEKLNRLIAENKIKKDSRLLFVNDGSRDRTLELLHKEAANNNQVSVLSFTANFGHQSAILAGMVTARKYADMVITIDADLQQDIEAMDAFIACFDKGCDVVYGVRNDRHSDGLFKKMTASAYYGLMHMLGCDIIANHADYRLMSKKALDTLAEYKEVNLFMRGLVPSMGFSSDIVYFDVKKREAGESKYTLKKMLNLAIDGITSFSVKPLRIVMVLGLLVCLFSLGMMIFSFVDWMKGNAVAGYTTSLMITLIMNGITLLSIGVVGEYIGKIYMEAKGRPRYIIDSFVWKDDSSDGE